MVNSWLAPRQSSRYNRQAKPPLLMNASDERHSNSQQALKPAMRPTPTATPGADPMTSPDRIRGQRNLDSRTLAGRPAHHATDDLHRVNIIDATARQPPLAASKANVPPSSHKDHFDTVTITTSAKTTIYAINCWSEFRRNLCKTRPCRMLDAFCIIEQTGLLILYGSGTSGIINCYH